MRRRPPSVRDSLRHRTYPGALRAARDLRGRRRGAGDGTRNNGRALGTLGDVGIFSLGRGKNITCGSGGIIVTSSAPMASRAGPAVPAAQAGCGRGVEGVRAARCDGDVHPAAPVLVPGGPALPSPGQTIFPRTSVAPALGDEGGSPPGLAEPPCPVEPDPVGDGRLLQPAAVARAGRAARIPTCDCRSSSRRRERDRIHALSQERGLGLSVAYPTAINEIPEIRAVRQRPALSVRAARGRTPLDHPDPPVALGERQERHCRLRGGQGHGRARPSMGEAAS